MEIGTHCYKTSTRSENVEGSNQDNSTYDASSTIKLSIAQQGSCGVVEDVKEGCGLIEYQKGHCGIPNVPNGFFFRAKNTVSSSSRYLK